MNKNVISKYGWIAVCAFVISIALVFATPFGKYVMDGVSAVASGFINASNEAMSDEHTDKIVNKWEDKWKDPDPANCSHTNTELKNRKEATCAEKGYTGDTYCKDCKSKLSDGTELDMLEHITEAVDEIPATCTEKGVEACTQCINCKKIISGGEEIAELGHNIKILAKVDATCTATGWTEGQECQRCDFKVKQEIIPAKGHKEKIIPTVEATCTQPGTSGEVRCEVCNAFITSASVIPAKGHSWDSGIITIESTCKQAGQKTYTCKTCNKTKKESIAKVAHREVALAYIAPSCSVNGRQGGSHCEVCGEIIQAPTTIDKLPHTIKETNGQAATCTTSGYTGTGICSVCSYVETESKEIPALGHIEVKDSAVVPTCTTVGKTEGKHCSRCNAILTAQTTIPATGHTEVIDEAIAATCTTAGRTEGKHCSLCNAVILAQTSTSALGHNEIIDNAVVATCTTTGLTEGKHCDRCNTVIKAQQVINALGHEYNSVVTASTCTQPGLLTDTCTVCGNIQTTDIVPLGHTTITCKSQTLPTCTTRGETVYGCERCTDIDTTTTATSLGHLDEVNDDVCDREICLATLEKDGTLKFVGTNAQLYNMHGNVSNTYTGWINTTYSSAVETPWYNERNNIKHVKITDSAMIQNTQNWFSGYATIETIYIGESVKNIGKNTFSGNAGINTITIPQGVTSIGDNAFNGCTNVSKINFNATNATVSSSAFTGVGMKTSETTITFGESVKTVPANAFSGSNIYITKVDFNTNSTCEVIGTGAFANNTNIKTVTLPKKLGAINGGAFNGCTGITNIYWNATNAICATTAFGNAGASGLVATFASNTQVPEGCFQNNANLAKVIFSANSKIGNNAFMNCTNLSSVSLGNVTSIGDNAFKNTRISTIVIPSSVSYLGNHAFANCRQLTNIEINSNSIMNKTYSASSSPFYSTSTTNPITVKIGASVTKTAPYLFANSGVTSVTFVSSTNFTNFEEGTFYGSRIKTMTAPKSLSFIGRRCFANTPLSQFTINGGTSWFQWYAATSPTATSGTLVTSVSSKDMATRLTSDYVEKYIIKR